MKKESTHNVAFLGYDGIQLLDLVAPLEAFEITNTATQGIPYKTFIISENPTFISDSNIKVSRDFSLSEDLKIDTLVIPGGAGSRIPEVSNALKKWTFEHFDSIGRVLTVCTGIFIIADHPYLTGKDVVTHWKYTQLLQESYPQLIVDNDKLFIQQEKFYSAAGILSGIDLALNIIEEDHGVDTASFVAKYLVTYLKRSGYQSQFSEPLKFQTHNNAHLNRINRYVTDNFNKSITVQSLAEQVHISERHLNRLITKYFEMSAAKFIEHTKLEQSKIFLSKRDTSVSSVASQVGYTSSDSFRRSFKRKYGITPQSYQQQYQ